MLIFVRLLMLLACGPLLLPAGVCACRFASPEPKAVVEKSGCCTGHHHDDDEKEPSQPDDDHSPGCPASFAAVERVQWSEPTPDVTGELVPPAPVLAAFSRQPTDSFPHRLTPVLSPTSLPLYLSHCALVL